MTSDPQFQQLARRNQPLDIVFWKLKQLDYLFPAQQPPPFLSDLNQSTPFTIAAGFVASAEVDGVLSYFHCFK